jgi:beta-phosphoglucomutase
MMAGQLENKLVPGVRRFLDLYHHMPMAVASNAEPENVNFLLDGAGLRKYFKAVVDGHQVARPKPHPDVYLLAAQLLGAEPERCVVFEDSHSGAEAGVAAGMKVIGLSTTFVSLPGTCLTVDNFLSGELDSWLDARVWPG